MISFGVALMVFIALADVPVAQAKRFRTIDEIYRRIAIRHRTFGGMFVDGKRLKIWLTDDGESLKEVFTAVKGRLKSEVRGLEPMALAGRWNWVQLTQWRRRLLTLWDLPGASFSDIDEGINRVAFGFVDRRRVIDRVNAEIARQGVPREAVRIEQEPLAEVAPG